MSTVLSSSQRRALYDAHQTNQYMQEMFKNVLERVLREIRTLQDDNQDADPFETFRHLHRVVGNLIQYPKEEKYKKLKTSNRIVNKHLLRYQAVRSLLAYIGFCAEIPDQDEKTAEAEEIDSKNIVWIHRASSESGSMGIGMLEAVSSQIEEILNDLKRERQSPAKAIMEVIRCAPAGLRFLMKPPSQTLPDSQPFMGIKNIGSVCYLNSMLQVLFFNSAFRRLLFSFERPEDGNVDDVKDDAKFIIFVLQEFFYGLFTRVGYEGVADPTMLLQAFGWYGEQRYEQRDVSEFQIVFMDKIEEGLKNLTYHEEFRNLMFGKEVVRTFNDETDIKFEEQPFSAISLQMSEAATLEEALFSYIEGTHDIEFSVDGVRTTVKQQWQLHRLPPVLQFHLQRFDVNPELNQCTKIHDRLTFPEHLDMSAYILDSDIEEGSLEYELFGVLVHSGTTNAGHYWAYIKCSVIEEGQERRAWFCFNDSQVTETTWEEVQRNAYGRNSDGFEDEEKANIGDQLLPLLEGNSDGLESLKTFLSSMMYTTNIEHTSAYMMIYVEKSQAAQIMCPLESDYSEPMFHDLCSAIRKSDARRKDKFKEGMIVNEELLRRGLQPKRLCLCGKCMQRRKEQFAS